MVLSIGFVVLIVSNHHYLIICNDIMQQDVKPIAFCKRVPKIIQTASGQCPVFAIDPTKSGQFQDASGQSQPPPSLTLTAMPVKSVDVPGSVRSFCCEYTRAF
jgi:hypothetical protein